MPKELASKKKKESSERFEERVIHPVAKDNDAVAACATSSFPQARPDCCQPSSGISWKRRGGAGLGAGKP